MRTILTGMVRWLNQQAPGTCTPTTEQPMIRNPVTLLLAGALSLAVPADASFALIEDFESHASAANFSGAGGWIEFGTSGATIVVDPDSVASQVAQLTGAANNAGYQLSLGASTVGSKFRFLMIELSVERADTHNLTQQQDDEVYANHKCCRPWPDSDLAG